MRFIVFLGFLVSFSALPAPAFSAPADECERGSSALSSADAQAPIKAVLECYQDIVEDVFFDLYPNYQTASEIPVCETGLWGSLNFLPLAAKFHRYQPLDASVPAVEVLITNSEFPNAFALPADEDALNSSAQIILSRGLVRLLSDRNELAFVLAHEMSHIVKDHFPILPPFVLTEAQLQHIQEVHRGWEFEADRSASALLARKEMNLEAPLRILERLAQAEAKTVSADTHATEESHPNAGERIAALRNDANGA